MASPIQQPLQSGGGKRKGKAQYVQAKRARRCDGGRLRQLEPGLQGILITCNMNERKCVEEAYSLLNEYGDDLFGPEKVRTPGQSDGRAGRAAIRPFREAGRLVALPRMREFCRLSDDEVGVASPTIPPPRVVSVADPPLILNLKCLHFAFPLLITVAPVYRLLPVIQALCYGSTLRST